MPRLFEPLSVGSLHLPNRFMRSATAERLAHPETGAPLPKLALLYRRLAEGGVGLIVTGHAYVARAGKAHPEMASMAEDALIPAWRETIRPAQQVGAKVMMQLRTLDFISGAFSTTKIAIHLQQHQRNAPFI